MAHLAAAIANEFRDVAASAGGRLDPMKIQKLVYFAHGWHLAYDRGALSAEDAEAWSYGPVFPSLYHALKSWGSGPILEPARALKLTGALRWETPQIPTTEVFSIRLVGRVWDVYGKMSGLALSQLTHERGGPWRATRDSNPGIRGPVIPNSLIKDYFRRQLEANARRQA